MSGELVVAGQQRFLPVLTVGEAVQRRCAIVEFVKAVMKPNVDFGAIPGTNKPTLLKPGAEKLCTLFGLTTRFELIRSVEDWKGEEHDGEPFFYYLYRCQLWREDLLVAEGDGSCNSWEQKYRYRDAQRRCPHCGQAAIVRGRPEYGGGWLCFAKKGGCGAKFPDGDAQIEGQQVGRILNPDVADQVNTIQKMGQKRALIAATLLAVNASEFFTQDVEDLLQRPEPIVLPAEPAGEPAPSTRQDAGPDPEDALAGSAAQPGVAPPRSTAPPVATSPAVWTAPESEAVVEKAAWSVSAASIRAQVEERAREWNLTERADVARLAVLLLGRRPEKWTAAVWQEILEQPESAWRSACKSLRTVRTEG